jgi:hypothetical protein
MGKNKAEPRDPALRQLLDEHAQKLGVQPTNKPEPVTGDWGCFDRYPEEIAPLIAEEPLALREAVTKILGLPVGAPNWRIAAVLAVRELERLTLGREVSVLREELDTLVNGKGDES